MSQIASPVGDRASAPHDAQRIRKAPLRVQPLTHADPLLDAVPEPLIEADDRVVGSSDLQVDLQAAALGQRPLQATDQCRTDPGPRCSGRTATEYTHPR